MGANSRLAAGLTSMLALGSERGRWPSYAPIRSRDSGRTSDQALILTEIINRTETGINIAAETGISNESAA